MHLEDTTSQGTVALERLHALLAEALKEQYDETDGDAWSADHPPFDAVAEQALLNFLASNPQYIGEHDLRGRLYLPVHQAAYWMMTVVRARDPQATLTEWTLALHREVLPMHWDVLCDGESARAQDVPYWLERLDRCAEARRLIEAAQEQAARAWRGDLDGARRAAESLPARGTVRIDIP